MLRFIYLISTMQPRHNRDQIVKRMLPVVLLVSILGILYYLYAPTPSSPITEEVGHDTVSGEQSLISNETVTETLDVGDISIDNFPPPAIAAPTNQPLEGEEKPTLFKMLNASSTSTQKPPFPSLAQSNEPEKAEIITGFVKHLYKIRHTSNAWTTIKNNPSLNPVLFSQLAPLAKQLSTAFESVDILYSNYHQKDGTINPINSKILAVRTNKWTLFAKESGSKTLYYDYNGNAPEKSMSRAPFAYTQITSSFNLYRRHPITGRIRPHEGVDLKGAYGEALYATGDGMVTFAGWQSGYGRLVIIDHPNNHQTRYAHLSAIKVNTGQSVKRGQVIGHLGNSGASTGAHLHYEVRINGIPYDPMTVPLPSYEPLPSSEKTSWQQYARIYEGAIDDIKRTGKTNR